MNFNDDTFLNAKIKFTVSLRDYWSFRAARQRGTSNINKTVKSGKK